jgi:hypothetical protein
VARFHLKPGRDAVCFDLAIEFFGPMIEATLLVGERHAGCVQAWFHEPNFSFRISAVTCPFSAI